jgi:hypothetical protein
LHSVLLFWLFWEAAEKKAKEMVERNPTRINLVEKLEKLVET